MVLALAAEVASFACLYSRDPVKRLAKPSRVEDAEVDPFETEEIERILMLPCASAIHSGSLSPSRSGYAKERHLECYGHSSTRRARLWRS